MKIDKSLLLDTMGRPLTQGLFLEIGYDTRYAIFTFNDDDKEYEDKTYYSLKKLFLSCDDPTEYEFANKFLLGWRHWQRMNENIVLRKEFDVWREEFEVKLRSDAIRSIIDMTAEGANFQAAKWLADKGWDKRAAGRPSKAEIDRHKKINQRLGDELDNDIDRMNNIVEFKK
jgi:hypothetical protein